MRSIALTLALLAGSACAANPSPGGAPEPSPDSSGAWPAQFAGVDGSGDIVVADASDGRVARRLAPSAGRDVITLSIARGGTSLFYSVSSDVACGSTWTVPLAGGTPARISDGRSSAISPDGRSLAWVRQAGCDRGEGTLVVRDLTTGRDRTWTYPDEFEGPTAVIEWSADSRTLFLLGCGVDACGVLVFDPATAKTARDGRWISTMIDDRDFSWGSVIRRGEHLVVGVDYGDLGGSERFPLLEIDPATDRIVAELMPDWRTLNPQDFDEAGRTMLAIDEHDRLGRWEDGRFTPFASGYTDAIWIE